MTFNELMDPSVYDEQIKNTVYYAVGLKPNLSVSFFKTLLNDHIKLPAPIIVNYDLFRYRILVSQETLHVLLDYYNNSYFTQDIKRHLYINGPDSLSTLCKLVDIEVYLNYEKEKQDRPFRVNDIVLLTLDNRYYTIQKLNLKKNEAIINSRTVENSQNTSNESNTILKVKTAYLRHVS